MLSMPRVPRACIYMPVGKKNGSVHIYLWPTACCCQMLEMRTDVVHGIVEFTNHVRVDFFISFRIDSVLVVVRC